LVDAESKVNEMVDILDKILEKLQTVEEHKLIINKDRIISDLDTIITALKLEPDTNYADIKITPLEYKINDGETYEKFGNFKKIIDIKFEEYNKLYPEHGVNKKNYADVNGKKTKIMEEINIKILEITNLIQYMKDVNIELNNFMTVHDDALMNDIKVSETATTNDLTETIRNHMFRLNDTPMIIPAYDDSDTKSVNGGAHTPHSHIKILHSFAAKKDIWNKLEQEFDIVYKEYNKNYINMYIYERYLLFSITEKLTKQNYVIYKYINKGLILFYKRILDKLVKKIDKTIYKTNFTNREIYL
jgi:hypothetical protein